MLVARCRGDGQHRGAELDAGDGGLSRLVRQVEAGADGDFEDELAARLAGLPAGTDIVAYCRGRYCVFAPDAVRLLRARGFSARLLAGGLPDWRLAGLPVTAELASR